MQVTAQHYPRALRLLSADPARPVSACPRLRDTHPGLGDPASLPQLRLPLFASRCPPRESPTPYSQHRSLAHGPVWVQLLHEGAVPQPVEQRELGEAAHRAA